MLMHMMHRYSHLVALAEASRDLPTYYTLWTRGARQWRHGVEAKDTYLVTEIRYYLTRISAPGSSYKEIGKRERDGGIGCL